MAKVELDIQVQIDELRKGLDKTQKQLKDLQGRSDKTNKKMRNEVGKTSKVVDNFASKLAAVFTIGAAVQLTKSIISVRKEFEKFRAVLTNTLGSAAEANREFEKIQNFASKTPFSVRELTDSFVRLVNQGFKPTTEQMRKLGDLAASTGKEFIQLTEAIIDAQTGEFERLKEFGIRASKQGDIVTFTFKEVETQVDFTASAIQEYILSLGDMEGVTGAMAAISETLDGQLSNLRDSWENLLDVMGGETSGVFTTVIGFLAEFLDKVQGMSRIADPMQQAQTSILNLKDSISDLGKEEQLETIINEFNIIQSTIEAAREEITKLEGERPTIMQRVFEDRVHERKLIDASIESMTSYIASLELEQGMLKDLVEVIQVHGKVKEEDVEITDKQVKSAKELAKERKEYIKALLETRKLEEEDEKPAEFLTNMGEEQVAVTESITDRLKQEATDRVDHEIAEYERGLAAARKAEQEKRLIQQGTVEAAIAGLNLIAAADKENAALQQVVAIAKAVINGALGITKTAAELGYPAAIPFQIALGLQTLAQIATIRQQKFAQGHYEVLGGNRHAQGGVDIGLGEAEQGEGLAVFSRAATQKYGKFLPAFVKAINENEADLTGYSDGAYMIHFDDRKQVEKLEDIKQLLSKPEIRYEGKYRIEIRRGQKTKIKI